MTDFKGVRKFNREMRKFAKKQIPEVVARATAQIVLNVLKIAVEKTPVDTGRARGGWQVSIGSLPTPNKRKDKNGGPTIASGSSKAALAPPYQIIFISNAVEYIEVLENGLFRPADPGPSDVRFPSGKKIPGKTGTVLVKGGFHVQAPEGMLAIATQAAIHRANFELRNIKVR